MKDASFGRKQFETLSSVLLQVDLTPLWPVTPHHVAKPRSVQVVKGHQQFLFIETSQSDENTVDVLSLTIRIDWYAT